MIILFNGPPRSGKDAAADFFKERGFKHLSFKYQLYKETIRYFDVNEQWFMTRYKNRQEKEVPSALLGHMSCREAMIYVSEQVIKPKRGLDYFGKQVANEIDLNKDYCISDGGFIDELIPVINTVGSKNFVLVQLTREGCDYSTDSRRYFDGNIIQEFINEKETKINNKQAFITLCTPLPGPRLAAMADAVQSEPVANHGDPAPGEGTASSASQGIASYGQDHAHDHFGRTPGTRRRNILTKISNMRQEATLAQRYFAQKAMLITVPGTMPACPPPSLPDPLRLTWRGVVSSTRPLPRSLALPVLCAQRCAVDVLKSPPSHAPCAVVQFLADKGSGSPLACQSWR